MKSIKRFNEFSKINESTALEQLLENPENLWIVYNGDEPIGGMEYLHDAFHDLLIPMVADTEEEEYEMQDKIGDILIEVGDEYDDVEQEELDDAIDTIMNEMDKEPIYKIKKRNQLQ